MLPKETNFYIELQPGDHLSEKVGLVKRHIEHYLGYRADDPHYAQYVRDIPHVTLVCARTRNARLLHDGLYNETRVLRRLKYRIFHVERKEKPDGLIEIHYPIDVAYREKFLEFHKAALDAHVPYMTADPMKDSGKVVSHPKNWK